MATAYPHPPERWWSPKEMAGLRRDLTLARNHLAFLERLAAQPSNWGKVRTATPEMLEAKRVEIRQLEAVLTEQTPQLSLFITQDEEN